MTQTNSFQTLLKDLDDSNYDTLITHEKLRVKGWSFYYVVDPDLIGNFCFPFGIQKNRTRRLNDREIDREYIFDEQITLDILFHVISKNSRPIIFDEYLPEIKGLILTAKSSYDKVDLLKFNRWKRDVEDSIKAISTITENKDVLKEYIKQSFSSLIFLNSITDGLLKLTQLISYKTFMFTSDELDNTLLQDACDRCRGSEERIEQIFELYKKLFSSDKFIYKQSGKDRDSKVVSRILDINSYIQLHGRGESAKSIFVLVVDSPSTKKVFEELIDLDLISYPIINNQKIMLCLSTQELFALILSFERNSEGTIIPEKTIQNLETIKKTNSKINQFIKGTKKYLEKSGENVNIEVTSDPIFENYNVLRNAYENTGLFKNYSDIVPDLLNDSDVDESSIINSFLQKIDEHKIVLIKEIAQDQLEMLDDLYNESLFNSRFIQSIDSIKNNITVFDLSVGEDIVEGSYQHLPFLLKFSNKHYHSQTNSIIQFILTNKTTESNLLCNQLSELLSRLYGIKSKQESSEEEKIIKALIFLLLPEAGLKADNNLSNEKLAYNWLSKIKIKNTKDLESEIYYVLCWICRRQKKYENSLIYAEQGKAKFSHDPRFHHGYALTQYCILNWNDRESSETDLSHLTLINDVLTHSTIAQQLYPNFITANYIEQEALIRKINDSFRNNLCCFLTIKAEIMRELKHPKQEIVNTLSDARVNLDKLKVNKSYVEDLAEYYDTEARLEYLEADYRELCNITPQEKLQRALEAIEKAINKTNQEKLRNRYKDMKDRIENKRLSI